MAPSRELTCPQCGWSALCGTDTMLRWLRRHGRLKRADDVDADLVTELFTANTNRFSCPECGAVGLLAGLAREENADWEFNRTCDVCGKPLSPDRLEVFPDTRVCAECKRGEEQGNPGSEPEYCPRCGAILQVARTRGSGITRYRMMCPDCGRK